MFASASVQHQKHTYTTISGDMDGQRRVKTDAPCEVGVVELADVNDCFRATVGNKSCEKRACLMIPVDPSLDDEMQGSHMESTTSCPRVSFIAFDWLRVLAVSRDHVNTTNFSVLLRCSSSSR